ncbi:MAG: phosphoribosyltransferase [Acidobacteria bacterium]|nr:phosphoribosyltransferase [Acidobacteriota bacterium]
MFEDRVDAGLKLGAHLRAIVPRGRGATIVVLAIPRGGVIVAGPVADALGAPLDIVVPRKIGAPGEPELAVGALALAEDEEIAIVDPVSVTRLAVPDDYLRREIARQRREIDRRVEAYRRGRPAEPVADRTAILVDDGIATGLTARAAAAAVARLRPRELLVAVPVAPAETVEEFRGQGLRLVALEAPGLFMAVGQFYRDFHAVEDDEVRAVLDAHNPPPAC